MSMLTRTGTSVRKHRRRQSGKGNRRGSAPTILLQSNAATATPVSIHIELNGRALITPQPSPAKSVSFTFEKGLASPSPTHSVTEDPALPTEVKKYYGSTFLYNQVETALPRERSYSIITSLQEANVEAYGTGDFVEKAFVIVGDTWVATLCIGLLIGFPLAMMTAGGKYLEECPKEPKIPIYLLVGGCFGLVKLLFLMWRQIRRQYYGNVDEIVAGADIGDVLTISRMTNVSLSIFLCVWFVLGNYWVFSIWIPNFKSPLHDPQNWCERHVFIFAFWQIVACYILTGVFFIITFLFSCCHWILQCAPSSDDTAC